MALDGSNSPPHESRDFAPAEPATAQQFSKSSSSLERSNAPLTPFEKWTMGRSPDTFNAVAGAVGGFTSGIMTCPLDVIKTKLQAQGGFRHQAHQPQTHLVYRGLVGTGGTIWREEGIRGLYRGLGPIILGYLPTWAVYFTVYDRCKTSLTKNFGHEDSPVINMGSAIVAGGSSTMVTNPIWVIKTRLMSQVSSKSSFQEFRPPWHYRNTLDAARKMYKNEGLLSFYSGLTPALLGLTHVAVQFPAYEFLMKKFTGHGMGRSEGGDFHFWGKLSAGVLSKFMASFATYPHEVIRTRLQTQQRFLPPTARDFAVFRDGLEGPEYRGTASPREKIKSVIPRYKGIVMTFKTILREEGWRAFYAGMGTNMMRAVPASATTLITYEWAMKQLKEARSEGLRKTETGWNFFIVNVFGIRKRGQIASSAFWGGVLLLLAFGLIPSCMGSGRVPQQAIWFIAGAYTYLWGTILASVGGL